MSEITYQIQVHTRVIVDGVPGEVVGKKSDCPIIQFDKDKGKEPPIAYVVRPDLIQVVLETKSQAERIPIAYL